MQLARTRRRSLFAILLAIFSLTAHSARADWTPVTAPTTEDLWGVCYGANQFVAVGTAGTILTSLDGTAWIARTSGTSNWLTAVTYAADRNLFVAVGADGTLLTSPDALVWTSRTSGTAQRLNNVAYAAGRFLAVGEAGTVCTSTDAITWTVTTLPLGTWLRGLCYGPDSFLIGAGDGTLCSTEDGTHFRYHGKIDNKLSSLPQSVEALFYTNGLTFAASANGGILFSTDRVNWGAKAGGGTPTYRGLAKSGLSVVAVGSGGATFGAYYGTAFMSPPSYGTLGTANLNAIVLGPPGAVTVGDHGTIYTSFSSYPPDLRLNGTTLQPVTLYLGGMMTLSPDFSGTPPYTFQWSHNGEPIPGATNESLVVRNLTPADSGTYSLTITDTVGSATTSRAIPPFSHPPSTVVDAGFFTSGSYNIVPLSGDRFVGQTGPYIFRFNADGTIDPTFNAAANSGTLLASLDGTLFAYRRNFALARLKADGSVDPTFSPDTDYGQPLFLADGRIVCVAIDSANVVTLTRLHANGSRDSSYPATSFSLDPTITMGSLGPTFFGITSTRDVSGRTIVAAVSAQSVGTGYFGKNESSFFCLAPDGTLDVSFSPVTLDESVTQLVSVDNKLYATTTWRDGPLGSIFKFAVIRLKADATRDVAYSPVVFTYGLSNHWPPILLADGTFLKGSAEGIERYTTAGLYDAAFSARLSFDTWDRSLILTPFSDGSILVAGSFTSLNGVPTAGLARIVPTTDAYATRLTNLSIRTTAGTGDQTLIAGFVIAGDAAQSRSVLARAVGPGLIPLGVRAADALADPRLTLHRGSASIATNDDWDFSLDAQASLLGAFPLAQNSRDAALLAPLAPGAYSAHVTPSGSSAAPVSGLALVELYDADLAPTSATSPRLVNLSGRARVGTDDNVLIAGFVLAGHSTKRILIRAIGPALLAQGIGDALLDPVVSVYHGAQLVGENDNWSSSDAGIFIAVGAGSLPSGSADSALVLDLAPGVYSAVVKGANRTTGTALVEIYEVP